MPLTFPAHQLLVLPLLRGKKLSPLPGAALLLGTALPDLAFVVGGYQLNAISHLAYGPLLMCPTVGLFLYAWAETLFLPALARSLPSEGRWPLARLCVTRGLPRTFSTWAWALGALLVGAYSHLFFDGWTHASMWPARVLYPHAHLEVAGLGVGAAKGLQGAFSAFASLVVLSWAHRTMMASPASVSPTGWRRAFATLLGLSVAGAVAGAAVGLAIFGWPESSRQLVLILMSPLAVGAFVGVTAVAWLRRPRPSPAGTPPR